MTEISVQVMSVMDQVCVNTLITMHHVMMAFSAMGLIRAAVEAVLSMQATLVQMTVCTVVELKAVMR